MNKTIEDLERQYHLDQPQDVLNEFNESLASEALRRTVLRLQILSPEIEEPPQEVAA